MSYFDNELLICYGTGTDTHMPSYRVDGFHVMILTNSTTHQGNLLRPSVDAQKQQKDFYFESQKTYLESSSPEAVLLRTWWCPTLQLGTSLRAL